jgi:hypothetical protein
MNFKNFKIDFEHKALAYHLNTEEYSWLNNAFDDYINLGETDEEYYNELYYFLFTENVCGDISVIDIETGEDFSEDSEDLDLDWSEILSKLFMEIVEFYKSGSWKV